MSSSAAGTREKPGKRVRQKTNLNRCILDQGWGLFRQQLEYKMRWSGGILLAVPAHYTSQECPKCHYIAEDNRKTQAKFRCVGCLYENNADLVGSMNIEERGHRLLARGEPVKLNRSVKQEPTEVSQLTFS